MRLFRGPKRREVTAQRVVATPSPRRDAAAPAAAPHTHAHTTHASHATNAHDFALVTALPAMVMEDDVKEMKKGTYKNITKELCVDLTESIFMFASWLFDHCN